MPANITPAEEARMAPGPNAEEEAGFFSRYTLHWYSRYLAISTAKDGPLEISDLGRVHPNDSAEHQHALLQELWDQEVDEAGLASASLVKVWFRFIGTGEMILLLGLAIATALASTGPPLIAFVLIRFVEGKQELNLGQKAGLLAGMMVFPLLGGFANSQLQFRGKRASLHAYAALTTKMYRKALKLSSVGMSRVSTGRLVHMFSADAGTSMERVVVMAAPAAIAPIQFLVYITLIYLELGYSAFASLGLIVMILPLNVLIFSRVIKAYAGCQGATDKRVKLVNELVTGIRIVKFNSWEEPFKAVINSARATELGWIRMHAYWMSIGLQTVFLQLPALIQLAAIATFVLTGGEADPAVIFTSIMFFQLLQQPVAQMPNALSQVAQVLVGLRRRSTRLDLCALAQPPRFPYNKDPLETRASPYKAAIGAY